MTAKKYLSKIKRLDDIVRSKLDQIQQIKTMCTKITATLNDNKVQSSNMSKSKTEDAICRLIELEDDLNQSINELVDYKREAISYIEQLDNDDYKLLLTLRHINLKTFEEIAVNMSFTFQWVHVLHSRALAEFSEKFIRVDSN